MPQTSLPLQTRLLKGAELAAKLRVEIAASKAHLRQLGGAAPVLVTLLVGEDPAAQAYRTSIARAFTRVNIVHQPMTLPATTSASDLVIAIQALNHDAAVTGVLVLMPLPAHLDAHLIIEHLLPLKDVDGITPTNSGRLHLGLPSLRPSTPQGGLELLDFYGISLPGKEITVVGRSNVVGRPLATLLTQRHATVTLCHRQTIDLAATTRRADIVCVAAGHAGLITGEMIRPGAVVLDFGVNVVNGKLKGDADQGSLTGVAAALTPVPGGTGPVTSLVLARNVIAAGFAQLRGTLDLPPELLAEAVAAEK